MKLRIAVVLLVAVLLCGCAGEPSPAPTPSPVPSFASSPTPEPSPEPTPEPSPEPTPDPGRYVPILCYHAIGDVPDDAMFVTERTLEAQLTAVRDAGYTPVFLRELADYADGAAPLPEHPVAITFDDGYSCVPELAGPILSRCEMTATVFLIGVSVGQATYKGTGVAIYPHFDYATGRKMMESGVFDLQSHTYDLHNVYGLDIPYRQGVLQMEGESDEAYVRVLNEDLHRSRTELEENTGADVIALCYPYGLHSEASEKVYRELGVRITLTTEPGVSRIVPGQPDTLFGLERITVTEDMSPETLLALMEKIE